VNGGRVFLSLLFDDSLFGFSSIAAAPSILCHLPGHAAHSITLGGNLCLSRPTVNAPDSLLRSGLPSEPALYAENKFAVVHFRSRWHIIVLGIKLGLIPLIRFSTL